MILSIDINLRGGLCMLIGTVNNFEADSWLPDV